MPRVSMGGFDVGGCIPACVVVIAILVGAAIACQGAVTGDSLLMLVGIAIALGAITLAGGGYLKFHL